MRSPERWGLLAAATVLVVLLPALNALPAGSPLRVSDFTLNLFGKFLAYAILALGIDLIWGYTGVLSLGHSVFFGLGAYAMGMHLMLEIGTRSVYGNVLPDFLVWNRVTEVPPSCVPSPLQPLLQLALPSRGGAGRPRAFRLRVRLPHVPQPHPRRVLLDHHPGPGPVHLADVQPERDEPGRHQRAQRVQVHLRLRPEQPGDAADPLRRDRALPVRSVPGLPRHHPVARGPGADRHPRQRDPRALLRLLARRLRALRVHRVRGAGRRGRRALRPAGRRHHAPAGW